jgi:uncharacterized protein
MSTVRLRRVAPSSHDGTTMGRWTPLVTMLPAGVALVAGIHYYLWLRLVRDLALPASTANALTVLLVVLAVGIPVGVIASRFVSTRWSVWWLGPLYTWIGTSFFLALALGAMDLVRIGTASIRWPLAVAELDAARLRALVAIIVALGAAACVGHARGAQGRRRARRDPDAEVAA